MSIDTNVLLDLLLDQDNTSIAKLDRCRRDCDELTICGVVYGELVPFFAARQANPDLFLAELDITLLTCEKKDYALAGQKWHEYSRRRRIVCPVCAKTVQLHCPHCQNGIRFRQHILSDFIIGAFSQRRCDAILTRDYGYYATYFPELTQL